MPVAIPTQFFLAKFNSAQLNYHVTDKEFLAVVLVCRALEQHLIGYPFVIVTNHQTLCTIKTQKLRQMPRHICMCLKLSHFDFKFEFIAGKNNSLANLLSRLWEVKEGSQEDQVKEKELEEMFFDGEHQEFTTPGESLPKELPYTSPSPNQLRPVDFAFGPQGHNCETGSPGCHLLVENIMDANDLSAGPLSPPLDPIVVTQVHAIAAAPAHDPPIPVDAYTNKLDLLGAATNEANNTPVVHRPPDPLPQPFLNAVIRAYTTNPQAQVIANDPLLWPMFCVTKEGRILCVHPDESLSLFVPCGLATGIIDFMTGLPPVKFEGMMVAQIMVVTDTWGKMVHLIPLPANADSELVTNKYYATIFRLHGTPSAIVSDHDPKFTLQFWQALQAKVGRVLRMSTAAHPETNGSSKNHIKMVTQTLQIMIQQLHNLDMTDAIIGAHLNQSHQANKHCRPDDPAFWTGSYVYLSTKNLAVPKGMKSKLLPHYIGPFCIRSAIPATSSYNLDLPTAMLRVHNCFHAQLLHPYIENDTERFPGRDPTVLFVDDVANAADNSAIPEWIVRDCQNACGVCLFLVQMVGCNDTDNTWISEQSLCLNHPSGLNVYLACLDCSNRRLAAR
ncbi:BQ2448_7130 [Microbotryum intermedium]|uniref:BQ2448_7130 protein n=1 Tax=Microbotryum intermedium TaxID=269621 RepID=A0A238FJ72_9BASI|nr:BQ2448_7130 [Microbotryum intermedium]